MFKLLSFILLVPLMTNSFVQDKQLTKNLDQLIAEKYNSIVPGCTVLIAKDGKIILKKAYGIANVELNVPMQTDMIF